MLAGIDRRAMTGLSTGHLAVDFAGGAVPALLPFFKDRFDLSYTLVAVIVLASTFSSSVIQPLFGLWSDRRGALWLLSTGVAVAGVGIALAAAAPAYGLVVLCVVVSGLGTAAFHPEGSKFAAYASGDRRASGMSVFSVGGNIGYALGALVTTPIVIALGLTGGLLLMVPGLVVACMILRLVPYLVSLEPGEAERAAVAASAEKERPGAMVLLLVIVALRSVAWFGLLTFVPLWEVSIGNSKSYGSHLLSLMLVTGAVGTLLAGPAADRIGRRPVLMASNVVVPPAILVFVARRRRAGRARSVRDRSRGRRDVRRHDGDEPGVPAAAHRHGVGAVDRPVDRPRRDRGGDPRRRRRLRRPEDGVLRLRGCADPRSGADGAAAVVAGPARPGSRDGPVVR